MEMSHPAADESYRIEKQTSGMSSIASELQELKAQEEEQKTHRNSVNAEDSLAARRKSGDMFGSAPVQSAPTLAKEEVDKVVPTGLVQRSASAIQRDRAAPAPKAAVAPVDVPVEAGIVQRRASTMAQDAAPAAAAPAPVVPAPTAIRIDTAAAEDPSKDRRRSSYKPPAVKMTSFIDAPTKLKKVEKEETKEEDKKVDLRGALRQSSVNRGSQLPSQDEPSFTQ